ncbi:hypothetical protein BT93_J1281 [Corymbia citriodora subsp. variegata]|nr:hypothetical protein BT93_J1281 [Corymbia citriodora subsp. variegata]
MKIRHIYQYALNCFKTDKARQQAREPTHEANRPKTKGELAKTLEQQDPFIVLRARQCNHGRLIKQTDPEAKTTSAKKYLSPRLI